MQERIIRKEILELSAKILELGKASRDERLFTFAESCTGGMAASFVTSVPGISAIFPGSVVTYGDRAKMEILGVTPETIATYGAVSGQCAAEMACGALRLLNTKLAVSVTGIAGPGGGSEEKPVGTVWFAMADKKGAFALKRAFYSRRNRHMVRLCAARSALILLIKGLMGFTYLSE